MLLIIRHRLLVLEAAFWLVYYRLVLKVLPFRKLAAAYQHAEPGTRSPPNARAVSPTKVAIQSAVRRLPFVCSCLCQALAAGRMLRRRGITSTVFIGATLDSTGEFESHAWIEAGTTIVAGATDVQRYKVMLTLSN